MTTPRDKVGTTYRKYTLEESRTFRQRRGMPAQYGYLEVTQVSSNIVLGTITEESLKTSQVKFTPWELAKLKKMLKDFDIRLMTWKQKGENGVESG